MDLFTALSAFVGGLVAAAIGGWTLWKTNKQSMEANLQAHWDAALLQHSETFVSSVRTLRHLAQRYARSIDKTAQRAALDAAHLQMRVSAGQLHLLGTPRVQVAARLVTHHAYSVRVQGEEGRDPRAHDHLGKPPVGRLNDALQEFHRAVRSQLRAPDAESVLHDDDLTVIGQGLQPLTLEQRSQTA
jgi:hypothetical protein